VPERPVFPAAVRMDNRRAAIEPRALVAGRHVPPPLWFIGTMALVTLVVVATIWLLVSGGRTVTATDGSSAVGGDNTNSPITVNRGRGTEP
jgi:hypothetical protein